MAHSYETLKIMVLQLLAERKMYGYELTQKVKEMNKDKMQITEGALYPTLYVLEKEGTLRTETEYIRRRLRRYYILDRSN